MTIWLVIEQDPDTQAIVLSAHAFEADADHERDALTERNKRNACAVWYDVQPIDY